PDGGGSGGSPSGLRPKTILGDGGSAPASPPLPTPPAASCPGTEPAARTEADVFHAADNAAGCSDHAGRPRAARRMN
ncbi:MAG: hypothetical protein VX955_11380, partial [Pseudomonadota bacterium]|nr:hypothetical protein [Pseudomonadota bacterium]